MSFCQSNVPSVVENINRIFESTFNGKCVLQQLENIHSNNISLWIVSSLYESYFNSLYREYRFVRILHFSTKRFRVITELMCLILYVTIQYLSPITQSSLLFVGLLYLHEHYGWFQKIFKTTDHAESGLSDVKLQGIPLIGFETEEERSHKSMFHRFS